MGVIFNTVDYNLGLIEKQSKLNNLFTTKGNYRIYGLIQENNPLILVTDNIEKRNLLPRKFILLRRFFKCNGMNIEIECGLTSKNNVKYYIGLRRDLRNHVPFCVSVVQMIVYSIEERTEINYQFKIPGIPKFGILK